VDNRFYRMPYVASGMRIGLYGGSFNPPHQGHKLVAEQALKTFQLDQVWWMVTPGNPLKNNQMLKPLSMRLDASQALIQNPRIHVTAFEASIKTRFSVETIAHILRKNSQVHFIWIMGADGLASFHQWRRWRTIAAIIPLAIIDRPGYSFSVLSSQAVQCLSHFRLREKEALSLPFQAAPCWCFIHGRRISLSSTYLRRNLQSA